MGFVCCRESDEFAELSEEFCGEYEKLDLSIKKRRKRKKKQIKVIFRLKGYCCLPDLMFVSLSLSLS